MDLVPGKPAILYYLSIDGGVAYKIGITNYSINHRFHVCEQDRIEVLKTWEYPLGSEAYRVEQEILKRYKDCKYAGAPLLHSGYTEMFYMDVLGLSSTTV